ncbi:MAG: phosphohistidine phosphatase SixA [Meiothermus sp.]|nr:phosphohistidine phosphatase SixA [Meiothermus sp.]
MNLYLVRHAAAEDAREGQTDDQRALTGEGIEKFRGVVRGLSRLEVRFDRLYHSPKLRAVQTAELLTGLLEGESEVTPNLAAPPSPQLLEQLRGERVALVGHEPWLGELCAWLLTGEMGGAAFAFKKGGVAWLEGSPAPGGMKLLAFLPPKVLRSAH